MIEKDKRVSNAYNVFTAESLGIVHHNKGTNKLELEIGAIVTFNIL